MEAAKIAFFDAKPYDREFFDKSNRAYGLDLTYFENKLGRETIELTRGFAAVCIFVNDLVDATVADGLARNGIRLVALRSAGYNNVDLKSVHNRIHVVHVPAYSPHAVAEHAFALILALDRKTHRAYFRTRDGNFSINGLMGFDLHGKTAGVIGTGKIGKAFAQIALGFGMKVIAHDVFQNPKLAATAGIRYADLDTLYRESDVISLHCPLTPENVHMINAASIAKMKTGVMLINTGRGKLIHTSDLIEGLKSGKIGSAGLDVYEEETEYFFEDFSASFIGDDVLARLLSFPNVLVTSHQGFFTREAVGNIANTTLKNIHDFFMDGKLDNEICYRCVETGCPKPVQGKCF